VRRRRHQVQCNAVAVAELGREQVFGFELGIGVGEAEFDRLVGEFGPLVGELAGVEYCSLCASNAVSALTVELTGKICTAGCSPKKFGSVYRNPITSVAAIRALFPERVAVHFEDVRR
jgi:hypothetical protein